MRHVTDSPHHNHQCSHSSIKAQNYSTAIMDGDMPQKGGQSARRGMHWAGFQ